MQKCFPSPVPVWSWHCRLYYVFVAEKSGGQEVADKVLTIVNDAMQKLQKFPPVKVCDLLLPPTSAELEKSLAELEEALATIASSCPFLTLPDKPTRKAPVSQCQEVFEQSSSNPRVQSE